MPACWSLLVIGHVVHAVTVGDYFDSFPSLESDFGQDDLYGYGSSFRDLRRGGGSAYDDYFGGPYGGFGSFGHADRDRKESGKDSGKDCSRIEADGIPLADLLREAAENLPQNLSETPAEILELVRFFSSQEQRRFLLTHCPQAVALSVLLEAEIEAKKTSAGRPVQDEMLKDVVSPLGEMLQLAPTLRSPYKAPPVWTGKPWGDVLNSAQHRTGVVLFPIGEQQFHVDFVSAVDWSIWANRRCRGRRDLGNLQGVPLASCLEKCSLHPSCRSATFWHWQPGGMGFDQRCFLSSSCTYQLSTDEGAEGAFLFEKLALLSVAEQDLVHERLRSPNAAWAPRAGHQLLAANSGNGIRLLLMGGIGVDPFVNTTQDEDGKKMTSQDGKVAKHDKKQKGGKGKGSAQARSAEARSRRQSNFTGMLNVVQAYLSRHVELSGELPPLRSLPYGRLGDLWMSEDEGTSWTLLQQKAPWGPRAFFGAAAVDSRLLVFGGIRTPEASSNQTDDLPRQYVNDVWTAALPDLVWRELPAAPWEARAGFQALAWQPDKSGEEILLFGGRLERGDLKNDVWALRLDELDRHSDGSPAWRLVTAAASWCPRSDFASAFAGQSHSLWIFGGSGQDGRALADVWRSTDGASWFQVQAAASWGPRIGATAVTLQWQADVADVADVMLLFGGYSYFDDGFGPIQPGNASDKGTAWISTDGTAWSPLPPDSLAWTQGTMHAASVVAPCDMTVRPVKAGQTCSYVTGGISDEGYFDNAVRRLQVGQREDDLLKSTIAKPYAAGVESLTSNWSENPTRTTPTTSSTNVKVEHAVGLSLLLSLVLLWTCLERAAGWTDPDKSNVPPSMRCLTRLLFGMVALLFAVGGVAGTVLLSISKELAKIRTEAPTCQIDDNLTSVLWHALGLAESAARWDEFEVLLRLASHESQYGYGFGYGAGGKASDIYGTRYDRGYDAYGPYDAPGPKEAPSLKKELSLLPTIQSVSCRTPKCDRNATCLGASRSLASPYGCCSDYMMVMLNDITSWLKEQDIPYFITYGTLLGAVREKDILPWTQDMDIVVDRSHWPKLQQGLEAAEFFGGRRYLFGVDQWEERVSRVCADWEGFATSIVGGQESDRFSRPTDFHLDVYASDWWQITDLHLVDCVEPLGVTQLEIRGRNFSAPARPRACVEKLYGAEWRIPKRALAGVN